MKEFLNPKSMLTPGVAGSLMMFLVNGIAFQFPEIPVRYLALFLSFLLGAIVWFSETKGKSLVLQKTIFWVLNSLVIFVVGFGTMNLAVDATTASRNGTSHSWLIPIVSTGFAQDASKQGASLSTSNQVPAKIKSLSVSELRKQLVAEQVKNESLKRELESAKQEKAVEPLPPPPPPDKKQFFKRW